jgi:putative ABC transport system permease protein
MAPGWRKAVRDFWRERTRTVLVVLAIALGIAGFTAVLSSYAVLTRELDRGYLATNPASASVRTDAIDDRLVASILSGHGVRDAEPRRVVSGRIKAGPMEWRNLTLFVVKDYGNIRVSKLVPEQGAWPPAAGEILIERDAFPVARTSIGEDVTVRTTHGKEQTLRVAGRVHDVGQAQARMENIVYGYINLETLARLGEEPYLDQLKILVAENRFDEQHIRSVAADVRKVLESEGHPVSRIDIPQPGKHPHSDLMGVLLLGMASFGVFVLLLSGILVVNLLTAMMATQVRQIGVMKAIGATRGQIAGIYLSQAALLGAAAIFVAVPAGILGSRALCRAMGVFLNFDIQSFAAPAWVYLLVAAMGLLVPLLSAAHPVWKGSRVSVREALSDFGVSAGALRVGALDRALAGVRGLARPLLLAIRNSFRRRARLALTVFTLAAGGLFFMTALNVRASLIQTLDRLFRSKKFDLTVGFGTMVPTAAIERAIRKTPGVVRSEGWITTEGVFSGPGVTPLAESRNGASHTAVATTSGGPHDGGSEIGDRFAVVALPAESKVLALEIVKGRGLAPGDGDAIVVNNALAAKVPGLKVGGPISFRMGPAQTSWRAVGIAREPFSPAVAYVPLSFFEEHGHTGVVNNVRLALDRTDRASIQRVKEDLEKNLEAENVRAVSSTGKADSRFSFDQHMLMIYVFLIIVSCLLGGVGALGLMTTMSLNVLERRREMGILRAIGATPRVVWLIVVAEGAVMGILGWALAALAAWPVSKLLGDILVRLAFKGGLDFVFETRGLFLWLAVSVLLAAVSSFLPAWHASRRPVREAISYE